MGKASLSLLLLLIAITTSAQHNLSGSRRNSVYTYIYKLSVKEASSLYRSDMDKLKEAHLHTLVDSFNARKEDTPVLRSGNYLFVKAVENKLTAALQTVDDLHIKDLVNNRDLLITVHNTQGQLVKDIEVYAGHRRMPWDEQMQVFRLSKRKRPAMVSVLHQGVIHHYPLERISTIPFLRKLAWSFPLKYISDPLQKLTRRSRYRGYRDYFWSTTTHEAKFTGYMAFNKPMYKPGDTVKLKAYVIRKNGTPYQRPLNLRITSREFDTDTILTLVKPYRPGGYEYSFVLHDSLDIDLDENLLVTLEETRAKKRNTVSDDDDEDESEAKAGKRPAVMRGKFRYEEYELKSVTFQARSDEKEHNRGRQVAIYCKATDENELAVMDGRVHIWIVPEPYQQIPFRGAQVFLPDTLWSYSRTLETVGETKILLPDSIFPAVTFEYQVICQFLNTSNESRTVTLRQHFYRDQRRFVFKEQEDSFHISLMQAGKSVPAQATLTAYNHEEDTVYHQTISLPAVMPLHPYVTFYEAEVDSLWDDFTPKGQQSTLSCRSVRTKDSIIMQVYNPAGLHFWYSIYAGNKRIQRGYADSLYFTERVRTSKNYFVSLQYILNDRAQTATYVVPFKEKDLRIAVDQPQQVYPGQEVKVEITVADQQGEPVADADVTAWAFTKKFSNVYPSVPYLGKRYPGLRRYNSFKYKPRDIDDGALRLNWQRWSIAMGLDSIEYYRFLYPDSMYTNREPVKDHSSQFAPFVVRNGELQPIHLVYIDQVPRFFSQVQPDQPYSFALSPGKHHIRLRTHDQQVFIDSVYIAPGMKTILSVNTDRMQQGVKVMKSPDTLTRYEQEQWSKYMILVENNFGERLAVAEQNKVYRPLNLLSNNLLAGGHVLTGPFVPAEVGLHVKDRYTQSFMAEGNYLFNISQGLIKQKQLPYGRYAFNTHLSHESQRPRLSDVAWSATDIDSLWQDYLDHRNATRDLFVNTALRPAGNGVLRVGTPLDTAGKDLYVTAVFLFRYDDPDFARIYKGSSRELGYVQPGQYRILYLLTGNRYHVQENIQVKAYGINYYSAGKIVPHAADSTSKKLSEVLNSRESGWRSSYRNEDMDVVKQTFNNQYLDVSIYKREIRGTVMDAKSGLPLPGATISIKGTHVGTFTDAQGRFTLMVPDKGTLQIVYIGYNAISRRLTDEDHYELKLVAASNALNEVVVVGYGSVRKKSITGAVSTVRSDELSMQLQGRVPGILIRGGSSIAEASTPLYVVDGVIMAGSFIPDQSQIADISILKDGAATAIYGARAAHGVVIITTLKKAAADAAAKDGELPFAGNTLRTHFRDDAWWQPNLRTNKQGKTSFVAKVPDDITSWRTFVAVVADKKRTGFREDLVRSFKPLSASLAVPQFVVQGDSVQVIGKTMNYTADSMVLNRTFRYNDVILSEGQIGLRNAHIDSFMLTIPQKDSVKITYTIQKPGGYFDGEERSIPVYKQGVLETKGMFAMLDTDTSFVLQPDAALGTITLHAEASVFPALLEEIEGLRQYEYYCNEQLASKLKALLLKKRLYSHLKKDFKEAKDVRNFIGQLLQNKTDGLLWGWWKGNTISMWISMHVVEALLMAEKEGFAVSLNRQVVIDQLVVNYERYGFNDKVRCLRLWRSLNARVDYKGYIEKMTATHRRLSLFENILLAEQQQQEGMATRIDTLLAKQQHTMMGNAYWGEEGYRFYDNAVQVTLAMYRLLKNDGQHAALLKRIRYYFLEKRRDGKWRNTWESSLILETLLPDWLKQDEGNQPASMVITTTQPAATKQPAVTNTLPTVAATQPSVTNTQPAVITQFPYTASFTSGEKITIAGKKGMPVYFTAYQQGWNPAPRAVDSSFTVTSTFRRSGATQATLKGGEAVTLEVTVKVKADADFVMVEIPIPAGCSYNDKSQSYRNNEVHREHFKNKVSLFCNSLVKGEYTFTVSLMPRYAGVYHLNPAKAELMYFPVFYGRGGMKKVSIQ